MERVDGTLEVAQPVREVVEAGRHAARFAAARAETDDERQDVPRRPADAERAEDERDGAQRLASAVLLVLL